MARIVVRVRAGLAAHQPAIRRAFARRKAMRLLEIQTGTALRAHHAPVLQHAAARRARRRIRATRNRPGTGRPPAASTGSPHGRPEHRAALTNVSVVHAYRNLRTEHIQTNNQAASAQPRARHVPETPPPAPSGAMVGTRPPEHPPGACGRANSGGHSNTKRNVVSQSSHHCVTSATVACADTAPGTSTLRSRLL